MLQSVKKNPVKCRSSVHMDSTAGLPFGERSANKTAQTPSTINTESCSAVHHSDLYEPSWGGSPQSHRGAAFWEGSRLKEGPISIWQHDTHLRHRPRPSPWRFAGIQKVWSLGNSVEGLELVPYRFLWMDLWVTWSSSTLHTERFLTRRGGGTHREEIRIALSLLTEDTCRTSCN